MKVLDKVKNLPSKLKKQLQTALLLLCAIATFAVPAFGGGYNILKDESVISSAAAIEDVDLLLVAASAFGEARKVMNATDNDAKSVFTSNTSAIVGNKWQNIGLLVGARDALSGSTWSTYQSPITLSNTEVTTYGSDAFVNAYNKYKAFGFAVQNLNNSAQKSNSSAVSVEEGLDAMSNAAIKLGSFGTEFLNTYNPGPVLLALYDISYLSNAHYSSNKLVQIVRNNDVLYNIISFFGTKSVPGVPFSFFVLINAVIATFGLALSMFLTLLGNRSIGDGIRKFLIRIVIGTVGIYVIAHVLSTGLDLLDNTIGTVGSSSSAAYVENNLNVYDWYLTGFEVPSGITLDIDAKGNFVFSRENVRAINEYTYGRITGNSPNDDAIKERMETYSQNGNVGTASFITPSSTSSDGENEAWATDVYYAIMNNYAQNKESLMDGNDEESSPLYGKGDTFRITLSKYLWMSYLNVNQDGDIWHVTGSSSTVFYGLNPISAFNMVRSDFSGDAISATATVYPSLAYVAFDVTRGFSTTGSDHMNSITRFIASFTLILAAMKGLITIVTAGFGGILAGGTKTAFGSSHGFGQAIGGVIALVFGTIGISVIMSMTLSLLDTLYGISVSLVGETEIISTFLQPIQDAVGGIPVIGSLLMGICSSITEAILTLILALTFPKMGGIPITIFAQYMADLPGRIAEKAQMIDGMLLSGRSSAGGGLPGGPRGGQRGQYGRQAQSMANQAFSNGARQAGQVMKAGAAAAGSLAGASLATLGKAVNKKADNLEGKPGNPGISNWNELSPDQQARAAEVAAKTENWENMDEDARQAVLKEAGVYDDNNAQANTNGQIDNPEQEAESIDSDNSSNAEAPETGESLDENGNPINSDGAPMGENGEPLDENGNPVEPNAQTVDENGNPVNPAAVSEAGQTSAEAGDSSSMNENIVPTGGTGEAGESGKADGHTGDNTKTETGNADGTLNGNAEAGNNGATGDVGKSMAESQHIDGNTSGKVQETAESAEGHTMNVVENNSKEGDSQQLNTSVNANTKLDAQNVDNGMSVNEDNSKDVKGGDLNNSSLDGTNTNNSMTNVTGKAAAASAGGRTVTAAGQAANQANGQTNQTGRGLPQTHGEGRHESTQFAGNQVQYHSVNDKINQTAGNANTEVNAATQNSVQFNGSDVAEQSVAATSVNSPDRDMPQGMPTGRLDEDVNRTAQRAADSGDESQSMNGTSKSKWGKDMTIKEQKQARFLHAVGDGLQMAGGNRTMGQGVKEALGHAKDAAVAYTVPIELSDPNSHPFLTNVRRKREEREKRGQK